MTQLSDIFAIQAKEINPMSGELRMAASGKVGMSERKPMAEHDTPQYRALAKLVASLDFNVVQSRGGDEGVSNAAIAELQTAMLEAVNVLDGIKPETPIDLALLDLIAAIANDVGMGLAAGAEGVSRDSFESNQATMTLVSALRQGRILLGIAVER